MGKNPLFHWLALFADGMVGPDFEAGLARLKQVAERVPALERAAGRPSCTVLKNEANQGNARQINHLAGLWAACPRTYPQRAGIV